MKWWSAVRLLRRSTAFASQNLPRPESPRMYAGDVARFVVLGGAAADPHCIRLVFIAG
jgi:hypothetical protein